MALLYLLRDLLLQSKGTLGAAKRSAAAKLVARPQGTKSVGRRKNATSPRSATLFPSSHTSGHQGVICFAAACVNPNDRQSHESVIHHADSSRLLTIDLQHIVQAVEWE